MSHASRFNCTIEKMSVALSSRGARRSKSVDEMLSMSADVPRRLDLEASCPSRHRCRLRRLVVSLSAIVLSNTPLRQYSPWIQAVLEAGYNAHKNESARQDFVNFQRLLYQIENQSMSDV